MVPYVPLSYGIVPVWQQLHFMASVCQFPRILSHHPCAEHVQAFLSTIPIAISGSVHRGITWIELDILYRLSGRPKPIANPSDLAMAKPTFAQQLAHFKRMCRLLAKHVLSEANASAFAPGLSHVSPFMGLAIQGPQASLSFTAGVTDIG